LPFLQSVAQLDLARLATAGRRLSWTSVPFSTCRIRRSTTRGHSKPATVRVQGLIALVAVFARRTRAGFVSRRQRSWDSPFGAFSIDTVTGAFPPGRTHLLFLPPVNAPHGWRGAGPAGRSFWVLSRAEVPCDGQVISPPTAGGSLGLFPPRVLPPSPWPRFSAASSLALFTHGSLQSRTRRRLRVSIGDDLPAPVDRDPSRADATTLSGSLRQYAPQHSLVVLRRAYCFASRCAVRYRRLIVRSLTETQPSA
jgi:hypothetical protein